MRFFNQPVRLVLLSAILIFPAALLGEGTQTGTIAGIVLDPSGAPLPGVSVALSGPQGERIALTDANGRCRFPALSPGRYRLAAELLSLSADPLDADVFVNRTTEVRLSLHEEGVAPEDSNVIEGDPIQVVAETPVIDRFETRVGGNIRFENVDGLPLARIYQSVTQLLPGVTGGEDGNPNVSGALRGANVYLVDGVDTTDPTTGLFGMNLAYEAVSEIDVTTAAAGAEYGRVSGGVINVVTRSGTHDFRGLARWVASDNDWNADHEYDSSLVPHLRPEISAADAPGRLASTLAISLGGPVVPEKLFFSASWETNEQPFGRPTAIGFDWDEDRSVDSGALKLDWQPAPEHAVSVQHTFDSANFRAFSPFDQSPAENLSSQSSDPQQGASAPSSFIGFFDGLRDRPGDLFAVEQRAQDGNFSKVQWSWTATQNLTFELSAADQERRLDRGGFGTSSITGGAPHLTPVSEDLDDFFIFNGSTSEGFDERPRQQANASASYFLPGRRVDHELSVGFDFQDTESVTLSNVPGQDYTDPFLSEFGFDVQIAGQLFIDVDSDDDCFFFGINCDFAFRPDTGEFLPYVRLDFWRRPPLTSTEQTSALYISDTIVLDRWLFRVGLRWERLEGNGDLPPFVPGDSRGLVEDDDIAPRFAVTWDPQGDGNFLVHASWGRYYEPFLQQYLDTYNRVFPLSGVTEYFWGALFEDPFLNCDGVNPSLTPAETDCWVPTFSDGPVPQQGAQPNLELERSSIDEIVFGFDRRLSPNLGLSVSYVDREWNDLWDDTTLLNFDPVTGEADPRSRVENLDIAERSYQAVQLMLRRRYADNWQLMAAYTWSRTEGNFFRADGLDGFADLLDFTDATVVNRYGPAPYDRPHQLRVYGSYHLPLGRSDLTFAGAFRYSDGVPFERTVEEDIFLGDEFGFGPSVLRYLTPRGSERLSGNFNVDLALNYALRIGALDEYSFDLKAEIFNLTNENEQLGAESEIDDEGLFGLPRGLSDLQSPRSYRLTLGIRF